MLKESTVTLESAKLIGRRPKVVAAGGIAGLGAWCSSKKPSLQKQWFKNCILGIASCGAMALSNSVVSPLTLYGSRSREQLRFESSLNNVLF